MEEIGLVVVEAGKFDGQLAESTIGPIIPPIHGGIVGVQKLGDGPPIRSGLRAGDTEVDATQNRFQTQPIGDRARKVYFHQIIFAHGITIPLGPRDVHAHERSGGVDGADDLSHVSVSGAEGEVVGGGSFDKAELDRGGAGGGDVFVAEAKFAIQGVLHGRILGDFADLDPGSDAGTGVIRPVAVEVRKGFTGIILTVAVGIDEGISARSVPVGRFGGGVIVAGVTVIDVGPNLGDGGIRTHDHFVAGPAHRIAIAAGVNQIGLRSLGVVIKSLREGLIEGGLTLALEEGSGAEDMEPILQAGGEGVVVVMQMELNGGGIKIGHPERGQHFLFVGNGGGPAGEPRGSAGPFVFIGTDFVGELGPGGGFGDRGAGPPVIGSLFVTPEDFHCFGGSTAHVAGTLGIGSVCRVVDKKAVAAADGVALDPEDHIGGAFGKLGSTHSRRSGRSTYRIVGVVVEPGGLVAVFCSVVVGSGGTVVGRGGSANRFDISFGSRGTNLATGGVDGGKFFRMLAIAESRLFVAEEGVGTQAGRVVAFGGIVAEAGAVEVDATI